MHYSGPAWIIPQQLGNVNRNHADGPFFDTVLGKNKQQREK